MIAGTLVSFQPLLVLAVCLTGIVLSSSMIYFFSEFLGLNDYFERHKPELTHKIRARLEQPSGSVFVCLWSFVPLVPTDLVCYLAGSDAHELLEIHYGCARGRNHSVQLLRILRRCGGESMALGF